MRLYERLEVLRNFDKFAFAISLLKVARTTVSILDFFLDLSIGYKITEGWRADREAARQYEKSAQVVNVLARAFFLIDINSPKKFLYRHKAYVHPEFVLENDNVTLMGITTTHAFFCVTHKPEHDMRVTENAPFLFVFQFAFAEQLVIMPLSSFHRLADELGDPNDRKVTLIDMTGRCGSTLLCQMISRVPNARAFSECNAFVYSEFFYKQGLISFDEHKKNYQSCMRILCKPEHDTKITHILIKMSPLVVHTRCLTKELFPNMKSVFVTRNLRSVLMSWIKFKASLNPSFKDTMIGINFFMNCFPIPYRNEKWKRIITETRKWARPENVHLVYALFYAVPTDFYINNRSLFDMAMMYDDFLRDTDTETTELFKLMEIDLKHKARAMEALKSDSQKGTFGQRGNDKVIFTEEMWNEVDQLLQTCPTPLSSKMTVDEIKSLVYGTNGKN